MKTVQTIPNKQDIRREKQLNYGRSFVFFGGISSIFIIFFFFLALLFNKEFVTEELEIEMASQI